MSINRSASVCLVGAALALGTASFSSVASAADIPVKAVPKATPWVLDVHGYADLTFASGRVTPGGLRIYPNRGYLSQIDTGLSLDIYKNSTGLINSFTVFGGIWNEYWSSPPAGSRSWQEMDWWLGFSFGFARDWKFAAQILKFEFPGGLPTANMFVLSLSADDSKWGLPLALNPFVNLFYNTSGGSTVVLGKTENTYRVELGIKPSVSLAKYTGLPLSLTFPTWVTVGPSSYWNRADGTTNFCGTLSNAPCSSGSTGVFSTGLQAKYSLDAFVPKRLGSWYLKGGVQYYRIMNDSLLGAQVVTGAATSFANAKKDVFIGSGGLGFSF